MQDKKGARPKKSRPLSLHLFAWNPRPHSLTLVALFVGDIYADMQSLAIRIIALTGLALSTGACWSRISLKDYKKTVQSGLKVLPWPLEMEKLYGEADHLIIEYGRDRRPTNWQTVVFFNGRYSLTLEVKVEIDYDKSEVLRTVSEPKFYVREYKKIHVESQGGGVSSDMGDQWILDKTQWEKLSKNGGDWSSIGIPIKSGQPVPGFDEMARHWRGPIVQVPH